MVYSERVQNVGYYSHFSCYPRADTVTSVTDKPMCSSIKFCWYTQNQSSLNQTFCYDSKSKQRPKHVTQVEFGHRQHGHIVLASIVIYFHLANEYCKITSTRDVGLSKSMT